MSVFPKDAKLKCASCLARFSISNENLKGLKQANIIFCPKCQKSTGTRNVSFVEKFSRFYPRLINSIETIKDVGYELDSYVSYEDELIHLVYIESLKFKCLKCDSFFKVSIDRAVKYAKEPGLFSCKKCRIKPAKLTPVKEFFVCFNNVSRHGSVKLYPIKWDI